MEGVISSFEAVKGLPLTRWKVVSSSDDLKVFGFPVYLKADVSGHKTDIGAVCRCDNFEDALVVLKRMRKKFKGKEVVVQESFSDGVEMIVGLKRDDVFGVLLVVGFGGIFAEVKKDVSFRALPVSRRDVVEMVGELEGKGVFDARGKKYDLSGFCLLVEKVAKLGEKRGFVELDLNPVIVGEKKSLIVDVRVEF